MLNDKDIQKLVSVLATKKDLNDLKEDTFSLREVVQELSTAVDGLAKSVDDFRIEYGAIREQQKRHSDWIKQLANKTQTKIKV